MAILGRIQRVPEIEFSSYLAGLTKAWSTSALCLSRLKNAVQNSNFSTGNRGLPFMTSALRGEWGLAKRICSKGGCVNLVIYKLFLSADKRGGGNNKNLEFYSDITYKWKPPLWHYGAMFHLESW